MHYGTLALSGAGMLIIEATAVCPEGRISVGDLGLWNDDLEDALGEVLRVIRQHSSMPVAVQMAHAGRKASQATPWEGGTTLPPARGGWIPVAPSPLPHAPGDPEPHALTGEELQNLLKLYAAAATRAARIGFDAIELHAAHGYLLHEFLSPISNHRKDAYGGSLEHRMRFPLEVFATVRAAFAADRPVGVRISGADWAPDGWDIEQSVLFINEVKKLGCAYAHVSGGGLSAEQRIAPKPGYQVDMAARIKTETGLPTIAVGLITQPDQAETILVSGQADMVALGRAMLYNPRWPWHAAARLGASVAPVPQYLRSVPHGVKGLFGESS
jgi:2,4-dienoyl-CoA reductase-like NADH-dependent reductase (Old Yellow Enzyme family)